MLFPPLGKWNKSLVIPKPKPNPSNPCAGTLLYIGHVESLKKGVRVHSYYWERRRGSGNQLYSYKNQSRYTVLDTYKQRICEINSDGSEARLESGAQVKAYGHRQLCLAPIGRVVKYA